jgi:outer membrane protein assembly factor BamA
VGLGSACAGAGWAAPSGSTVAGIIFDGRMNVPESTLTGVMRLHAGGEFTPALLEADRKAILGLGFFRSVAASQQTTDGKTTVTFRLAELPRVVHIHFSGNSVVELKALQETITTRLGQVLCAPQLQDDVRAIERLYRERGYVGRVSEKLVDEATRSGVLHFQILEIRIGEVVVEGGTDREQERARAALAELPPDLYRPEAVTEDQQRLRHLRGIREATPKVETIEPGKVRIRWVLNGGASPEKPGKSR